ncbi:unnamed protein product [Cladocopium goreaui]|uniref:VOC domain-containing protein n=1 Tax=Cladocopium goreaui TaxID=2562237 RepID=A0A9P1D3E1_9DINO|nr:unnamed protein product [Cladocopium goreaui]
MKRKVESTEPATGGKPRYGIASNVVTENAASVQEAFCRATRSRIFFTLEDEATKRLMHGAVVTAFGGGGHVFFEDISLNPFKDTLNVPFLEYRCNNQSHVILHGNVLNAPALASKMLRSTALPGKCKDACGILWALSTKKEEDMEMSPQPPPVRSCVTVIDADAYLKFLQEVFGDTLVVEKVRKDDEGLQKADLLIMGSGFSVIRGAASASERSSFQLMVSGGKEAAGALGEVVSEVDGKWAVKMECGVHVTVCEPSSVAS